MKLDCLRYLFFIATVVLLSPLLSIKAQTRIDTWTTDNGLPQNSVTGLTETPDGYIWFTTYEGLVRFDGARFKVFNKSNTPEITNNRMSGAFADKSGAIWMRTEEGEILSYEKGVFNIAMKSGEVPPGSRSAFFNDPSGSVIFYVYYRRYLDNRSSYKHYRFHNGKFVPLTIEGIPENSYLILADREGGLWFADGHELRLYKGGKIKAFDFSGSAAAMFPGQPMRIVTEASG
jgi:ligand-binding sensor domain-containing protein